MSKRKKTVDDLIAAENERLLRQKLKHEEFLDSPVTRRELIALAEAIRDHGVDRFKIADSIESCAKGYL